MRSIASNIHCVTSLIWRRCSNPWGTRLEAVEFDKNAELFPNMPSVKNDVWQAQRAEAPSQQCSVGCGDPKRLGCGDPKRLGCSDPKRQGCSDPKRDLSNATSRYSTFDACPACRRTSYAKACMSSIGGTLQRYQEWALPFLRNQISQNDLIMRVFVVAGANISEYTAASRQTILFAGRQKLEMKPQLQPEHCIHECVHQTWQNQRCVAPGYGKQFPRIKPALQESDCGTSGKVLDNNRLQKCCGVKNKATTPQPNKQGPCSTTAPAKASSMCTGGGERPEMKRPAQCFFCQAQAPVFVPNAFASSYTAPCTICRRYACAVCCEWELQKPYCTWCAQSTPHASVTALQAAARVRATAKRYQFWQESPDWMDYLEFVSLASLVQTAVPSHPPLRSSQPELVFDPKDMFEALLISKVQDTHRVKMLLEQNWVPEWDGWMELAVLPSEKKCVELVQRFLTVALANEQDRAQSNERRLQELEVHGWKLIQASPHGVNNCLIDSLLLGLLSLKILQLPGDVSTRRTVCAACRAYLVTQYGGSMGTFLDAHYDVVRILFFSFK